MKLNSNFVLLFVLCGFAKTQVQLVCPGPASIQCTGMSPLVWRGTILMNECPTKSINFTADLFVNTDTVIRCGDYTAVLTNVLEMEDISLFTTSLSFTASPILNGTTVQCGTPGTTNRLDVDLQLVVPAIPIPTLVVIQDSLTAVTVNVSVEDDRCASLYFVEITEQGNSLPIIMNSTSPSVSVSGLNLCSNTYSVAGYVQAPNGMQGTRSSGEMIQVDLLVLQGVTNIQVIEVPSFALNWTQLPNNASTCINRYSVSWNGGSVESVTTSITAAELNDNGFPYCQSLLVTVTPLTLVGPVSTGASSASVFFDHPEFTTPSIMASFIHQSDDSFMLTIAWQDISSVAVPVRMYGFTVIGDECTPQFIVTGSSVIVLVSIPQSVHGYTVCVAFVNKECRESTAINVTVPLRFIRTVETTSVGDNGFSVRVLLVQPPPLDHNSLLIMSSISPPHAPVIFGDYPASSDQYLVTFSGLQSRTVYTYDMRVVLKNNRSANIGIPVTGSFPIEVILSRDASIALTVVLTFLVTLVVGVSIGVLGVLVVNKWRRSKQITLQTETEMRPPVAIYKEPKNITQDPHTQGNVAYGHIYTTSYSSMQ